MLRLALVFFVLAVVSALFGFGGLAASFAGLAEILFYLFLLLFVVFLLINLVSGRKTIPPV